MADNGRSGVEIGQKIYEIRKSEGLSQTEFAEKFHVTRQTVSNWEHGRNYPDMDTLMRISDEYGISFDDLIKSDKELIRSIDRSRNVAAKSMRIFALIGIVVIAAVIMKLLPGIVSKFYYDPTQIVAKYTDKNGYTSANGRLETDVRVYGELYLPETRYDHAVADSMGFGKYRFTLERTLIHDMEMEPAEIAGEIERNKFILYDPTSYKAPEWYPDPNYKSDEHTRSKFETLDENVVYISYITFKKPMRYEDACRWSNENGTGFAWAGIVTDDVESDIMGMYTVPNCDRQAFDTEKYPYLFGYREPFIEGEVDLYDESVAKTHFVSMMRYLADNPEFAKMLSSSDDPTFRKEYVKTLEKKIEYIDSHGMQVFGIAAEVERDELLRLLEDNSVANIELKW